MTCLTAVAALLSCGPILEHDGASLVLEGSRAAASFPWMPILQVGAGSGLTLLVQAFLNHKKASETAVSDHIADVLKLRETAMEFWLREGKGNPEDVAADVAPIHAAVAAVTAFSELAAATFGVESEATYRAKLQHLNRLITGGNFDSVERKRSPETAVEVARHSALLILLLRQHRSSLHGFHRPRQLVASTWRRSSSDFPFRMGKYLGRGIYSLRKMFSK